MSRLFCDSPEYTKRLATPFKISKITISQLRSVVPKHLYEKHTGKALLFVLRDVSCAVILYKLGWKIDLFSNLLELECQQCFPRLISMVTKWSLWCLYWHWQGVILAGWWCMAHEAGHGNLSNHNWVNHAIGYSLHTFVLAPYFAWRATHNSHHKAAMSIERDENYVPRTRSDYKLPSQTFARLSDYHEIFEDAPIYTLSRMLFMQAVGWQYYICFNAMGSPRHPPRTNHFRPSSSLFKPHERNGIIASDIGLTLMSFALYLWTRKVGLSYFLRLYFIPYILANHWIVMLTYLHHSDPSIPYYRKRAWTFLRGALSTVDRPLLGWAGRVFLHNVSHDHIAHHLFSSVPFYNQPQVTAAIKPVLGNDYNYDSTNTFRALYRTFTQCCFVEDEGDVVFYKNRDGIAQRELADSENYHSNN